jgi:purine-binding chemotaxis protein CheW
MDHGCAAVVIKERLLDWPPIDHFSRAVARKKPPAKTGGIAIPERKSTLPFPRLLFPFFSVLVAAEFFIYGRRGGGTMTLDLQSKAIRIEDSEITGDLEAGLLNRGQPTATREGKYLIFTLGDERYGLDILKVREIIGLQIIHELPQMPLFFKGVINLRDTIIPIMEMRSRFGMERVEYDDRTCIIVVEFSGRDGSRLVGIIVDAVSEVIAIKEQEVEPAPSIDGGTASECLLGVAKTVGGVTFLLDVDRLMQTREAIPTCTAI